MATSQEIYRVLLRNGTEQRNRTVKKLSPDSIDLHGFSLAEWLRFAYDFASKVNYFNQSSESTPSNDWQDFFIEPSEIEAFEIRIRTLISDSEADYARTVTPHLTLFVSFLLILEGKTKDTFNQLTAGHLDFYFGEVLNISKLPAVEDKVHVIFEMAKNATLPYQIAKETQLDANKDESGKKRIYKLSEELAGYHTQVASLKSVYNALPTKNALGVETVNYAIKAASVANSIDGIGGELTEESSTWFPFGYYDTEGILDKTELLDARLGFALASPVLALAEGTRKITITVTFNADVNPAGSTVLTKTDFTENLEVSLTGEKGWLGTFTPESESSVGSQSITLVVTVPVDEKAVVAYNSEVHGDYFNTTAPLIRFKLNVNNASGYSVYQRLVSLNLSLSQVAIGVAVTGLKSVSLENDFAALNEEKPFYPFTTQPVKGSSFTINSDEIFSKNWETFGFEMKWKNVEESLVDKYKAYKSQFRGIISKELFLEEIPVVAKNSGNWSASTSSSNLIVTSDSYFKAKATLYKNGGWQSIAGKDNVTLFTSDGGGGNYKCIQSFTNSNKTPTGGIRLSLNQSFLHDMYPRIYALALTSKITTTLIPKEPYTPLGEELTAYYTAADTLNFETVASVDPETLTGYESKSVALFHDHPFGQAEEFPYLKSIALANSTDTFCYLFPKYCKGGEFYIGLESIEKGQQVSLLIQVDEGSENPLSESFGENEKIQWDALCNNTWVQMDSSSMVINDTDNLLKSGIVRFTIPTGADTANTLLPPGLVWVRAKMLRSYDAVCQVVGIHTQASIAQFSNQGNELSHLQNGLPDGTISKLIERVGEIKSVSQPYNSFGGQSAESDDQYYRRVSERLRHKNRAITLWDYEHMVLQEFPSVYKVKCLNHTSSTSFSAPGYVTLVVVPDTTNKNMFDSYRPRVSVATLNSIKDYIGKHISMHVNLAVINPDYEEVKLKIGVRFRKGYDDNLYSKKLNEDITRFLSPWALDNSVTVSFGITLYKSLIVKYIEDLGYVDYISEIHLFQNGLLKQQKCEPSTPKAILVSARQHTIEIATNACSTSTESTVICQV